MRKNILTKELSKNTENRIHYDNGFFYFGTVKMYPNKEVANWSMKLSIEEITELIEKINEIIYHETQ